MQGLEIFVPKGVDLGEITPLFEAGGILHVLDHTRRTRHAESYQANDSITDDIHTMELLRRVKSGYAVEVQPIGLCACDISAFLDTTEFGSLNRCVPPSSCSAGTGSLMYFRRYINHTCAGQGQENCALMWLGGTTAYVAATWKDFPLDTWTELLMDYGQATTAYAQWCDDPDRDCCNQRAVVTPPTFCDLPLHSDIGPDAGLSVAPDLLEQECFTDSCCLLQGLSPIQLSVISVQ